MMTRTTRNGAAAALVIGLTMAADNVSEVFQRTKVAKTPNKRVTE